MNRICLICRKGFSVYPSYVERGGGLYCSRACKNKAQSARMKAEPPEKTPHWKGGKIKVLCANCGKEFDLKPCLVKANNFCSKNCSASFNVRLRPLKGLVLKCKVCGKEFYRNPSAINRKDKKPLYCSQRCRAIDSIKNQKKQNTDIENIVEKWLIEKHIVYEKQVNIEGIALTDFLVNSEFCIFADGDYWHSKSSRIKIDKRQAKQLIANGYTVVRLAGSDILSGKFKEQLCSIIN